MVSVISKTLPVPSGFGSRSTRTGTPATSSRPRRKARRLTTIRRHVRTTAPRTSSARRSRASYGSAVCAGASTSRLSRTLACDRRIFPEARARSLILFPWLKSATRQARRRAARQSADRGERGHRGFSAAQGSAIRSGEIAACRVIVEPVASFGRENPGHVEGRRRYSKSRTLFAYSRY